MCVISSPLKRVKVITKRKPVKEIDFYLLGIGSPSPDVVQFLTLSAALSLTTEIPLTWVMNERTRDPGDPSKSDQIRPTDP